MTVSRKNYVTVNIFLLIRNWEKGVREFSILHWILLVLKKSFQGWIMSFNNSNVLQKLFWFLDLFQKVSKTLVVGMFMHTRITLCWRSLNCWSTGDDLEHIKTLLAGTDVIKSCARERVNTKWKFFKLTNVTIFAALLKDIPMGCKDAKLPEPLLKNRTVNCLTSEQNTRQPYNDK